MNGCVYRTADNQCEKFSDPVKNTLSWCVGDTPCEARKLSNADRIRAMTDEELAKELERVDDSACMYNRPWTYKGWLDWLRKEADETYT